jgi:UDP-N-acetylmuramoyl-L-alanyl-D-glutamate--2,6-diaminopimelate ligase
LARHLLGGERRTAVIGTLGVVDERGVKPGTEGLTTPGPVQVAVWLRELADGGCAAVVIEASSHALEQCRLDGVSFDIAVFTNLSQDHLDYHGDMAGYLEAKARLVELVTPGGTIVVNADDPAWDGLDDAGRPRVSFSVDGSADLRATDVRLEGVGTAFTLHVEGGEHPVHTPFVGRYNVENTLAAIGVARAAGIGVRDIIERLRTAPHVSGRLEAIRSDPFTVLIDFAHTPAALDNALAAVKPLTSGRLIVVDAIIDDLAEALPDVDFVRAADRRDAIRAALTMARPGDTVVLAGKGHERYQVIGTEKRPFDERAITEAILADLGAA